jgi:hypothetical protein
LDLPFTQDEYELVRDLFKNFITDPEYGDGTWDDDKQRHILDTFANEGLLSFDRLMTERVNAPVESKLAHDITKALTHECVTTGDAHPDWSEFELASTAADFVALRSPAARADKAFAVHRAERTVLEATCSTFLFMVILEGSTEDDPMPKLEAVAQSIGLIWFQWLVWNKPLAFAAFKGRDEVP